jgi:putative protease
VCDEDGLTSETDAAIAFQPAQQAEQADASLRASLAKLGATMFVADSVELKLSKPWFVPSAAINALRRDAIEAHEAVRLAAWDRPERKAPAEPPQFPDTQLSYLANVYNEKARLLSQARRAADRRRLRGARGSRRSAADDHQALPALLVQPVPETGQGVQGVQVRAEPMTLVSGDETYTLRFDCKPAKCTWSAP